MPCLPLTDTSGKRRVGFVCVSESVTKLCRGVWMEWHSYFGPSFWSDEDCSKPIHDWYQKPRIVVAFDAWKVENPKPGDFINQGPLSAPFPK